MTNKTDREICEAAYPVKWGEIDGIEVLRGTDGYSVFKKTFTPDRVMELLDRLEVLEGQVANKVVKQQLKTIARLTARVKELTPRWIPVSERLPENGDVEMRIFVKYKNGRSSEDRGTYDTRKKRWHFYSNGLPVTQWTGKVTHWCPIPEIGEPE